MSKAPEFCLYCDKQGNSSAGGPCGFCINGKPLDTQEDWDKSWGKILDKTSEDWKNLAKEMLDSRSAHPCGICPLAMDFCRCENE